MSRWLVLAAALACLAVLSSAAWVGNAVLDGNDNGGTNDVPVIARLTSPDIHSLLIDPTDPDRVLFGSHAGIQESRDGGFTWNDGSLTGVDAMSMAVSPQDSATLYVAGHDVFMVSRDGGESWQPLAHDLPGTDVHAFAQDPLDPRRLYAFVVGVGVHASADGGTTWTLLPTQPPDGTPLALATNGVALFAGMNTGLVVTRDDGVTWERVAGDVPGVPLSVVALASDPWLLYVGTQVGLSKSTDGGRTWRWIAETGTPVLALAVAPSDAARVVMIGEGGAVACSDDGGDSWRSPR